MKKNNSEEEEIESTKEEINASKSDMDEKR